MGFLSRSIASTAAVVAASLITASSAFAAFGVASFSAEVRKSNTPGDLDTQAGSTPFTGVTDFTFNNNLNIPDGNVKDIRVDLPPGLMSNPQATPKCTDAQFPNCPSSTQLGTEALTLAPGLTVTEPVYNMVPKAGQLSLFSFDTPVGRTDIVGGIRDTSDYGLFFTISDVPQNANLLRSVLTFFGDPPTQNGSGGPSSPFIRLPTSCSGPQTTVLTVTSYAGETATSKSTTPTGATGCDVLPFAPQLAATTFAAGAGKPAGLTVKLTQTAAEANVSSVRVTLPAQLGVRIENLQHACPEATFKADPTTCAADSRVGSVSAVTPLLATRMTGDVYLEAHQGGALPSLEAILRAPGVQVHLSSTIDLSHGITSTFNGIPDVPISEFLLTLDSGPDSALAAKSDLCAQPLTATSTVTGQNGKTVDGTEPVAVAGCSVKIAAAKVGRKTVKVTVRSPAPGKVRVTGKGLVARTISVNGQGLRNLRMKLSHSGAKTLRRRHKLLVRLSASYAPATGASAGGQPVKASVSRKRVVFRAHR
jgi:hypothetical protein